MATTASPRSSAASAPAARSAHLIDVVGPNCESGDFLAKARPLVAGEGDLLAAMEVGQLDGIVERFGDDSRFQVTLTGLWSHPRRPHLHDPLNLCPAYFETCFGIIDSAISSRFFQSVNTSSLTVTSPSFELEALLTW